MKGLSKRGFSAEILVAKLAAVFRLVSSEKLDRLDMERLKNKQHTVEAGSTSSLKNHHPHWGPTIYILLSLSAVIELHAKSIAKICSV